MAIEGTETNELINSETQSSEIPDFVGISDEDFAKYVESGTFNFEVNLNTEPDKEEEEEETANSETSSTTEPENVSETVEENVEDSNVENSEEDENVDSNTTEEPVKSEPSEMDYKQAYEAIMKPFKANGKEVQPTSTEDVVSLMQMGAGFVKKMQTIKPMQKIIKSLEEANINEEKLNFLIDISKGNPDAIKKLVKDNKIDVMDLDTEEIKYSPSNNLVDDSYVEFSTILDDIKDTPEFTKTQTIATNVWDEQSRKLLLQKPELLKGLHQEVTMGRYDKVQGIIDRERIFGRLENKNDLEAYIDIVTEMTKTTVKPVNNSVSTPTQKNNVVTDVANKKAATLTTNKSKDKPNISKLTPSQLFSMSDEEILKLSEKGLF